MIREIKYRAYHKTLKIELDVLVIDWLNELVDLEGGLIEQEFKDVELLQYTGLKDKNGVEIYEGDIINYERRGKEQVGIVEYYASACSFLLSDTHLLLSAGAFVPYFVGEVIGNIYENPELLEHESK